MKPGCLAAPQAPPAVKHVSALERRNVRCTLEMRGVTG